MGKFVFIYRKGQQNWSRHRSILQDCLGGLEPYVGESKDELLWINDPKGIAKRGTSLATGIFSDTERELSKLKQFTFRLLSTTDEVVFESDVTGSRTVWYLVWNNTLYVSSSQRAIIALIGSFVPNKHAISWMLCTGCLGPGNSWDDRMRSLRADCLVRFNKERCVLELKLKSSLLPYVSEFSEVADEVFDNWNGSVKWGITLSGGYDSRYVLSRLVSSHIPIEALTWGSTDSIEQPGTDSDVAKRVSKAYGIPFHFYPIDKGDISPAEILRQFVRVGEGRIDHINAFTDGLRMWEQVSYEGFEVIVRADEAFGWLAASNEKDVRISLDLNTPEDYRQLVSMLELANLDHPKWPDDFSRNASESMASWRDRVYRNYRIPYILAALHDLMLPYVEIVNPLLDERFVRWSAVLRDIERTGKKKFRELSRDSLGDFPVASRPSIKEREEVIATSEWHAMITSKLTSDLSHDIFGSEFVKRLLDSYKIGDAGSKGTQKSVGQWLPLGVKKFLRRTVLPYKLPNNLIILRASIVVAMREQLMEDLRLNDKFAYG